MIGSSLVCRPQLGPAAAQRRRLSADRPARLHRRDRWGSASNAELKGFHQAIEKRRRQPPGALAAGAQDRRLLVLRPWRADAGGPWRLTDPRNLKQTALATLGWWHHSVENTIDKVDWDETAAASAGLWRLSLGVVHRAGAAVDYVPVADEILQRLTALKDEGDRLSLSPLIASAAALKGSGGPSRRCGTGAVDQRRTGRRDQCLPETSWAAVDPDHQLGQGYLWTGPLLADGAVDGAAFAVRAAAARRQQAHRGAAHDAGNSTCARSQPYCGHAFRRMCRNRGLSGAGWLELARVQHLRHRWCHPSPRGEGGERSEPGGEKSASIAGFSPPPRFARTLPSRGGMAPPVSLAIKARP